jgi:hypothetical protein
VSEEVETTIVAVDFHFSFDFALSQLDMLSKHFNLTQEVGCRLNFALHLLSLQSLQYLQQEINTQRAQFKRALSAQCSSHGLSENSCVLNRPKRCGGTGLCEGGGVLLAAFCPWCALAVGGVIVLGLAGYGAYHLYKHAFDEDNAMLRADIDMLKERLNDTIKYNIALQRCGLHALITLLTVAIQRE